MEMFDLQACIANLVPFSLRLRKMNVQTPLVLTVAVYQGHKTEGFTDLVPLAAVEVERWYMAPGVRRIDVTEGGLSATLFLPPGSIRIWGVKGQKTISL